MEFLIFITSGLFLGWSLGANDAANIFGTAVGTRMVKFQKAALIGSVFVILGAMFQGSGTTRTLSQLGSIDTLGGAFTAALCSAIIVTIMTWKKLPVSTGQAIVGAIIGWSYFTSRPVDYSVLTKIVGSWIAGPILGAVFSALLYLLMRRFIRKTRIHVIKLDIIIRLALIITGAFGAYSLGANNIANVMGVFVNSVSLSITIGSFTISSVQLLFFAGGVSIAIGIITYSKKVMETVGNGVLSLTPETAIVVVLAQALVLFLFSSTSLSNFLTGIGLPAIPLVPVSSTQVVIGSLIGIGIVRGVQEIRFEMLGSIAVGWLLTPVLAGLLTFFSLFFMQNVFGVAVKGGSSISEQPEMTQSVQNIVHLPVELNKIMIIIIIGIFVLSALIILLNFRKKKLKMLSDEKQLADQIRYTDFQKALSDIEMHNIRLENTTLAEHLEEKRRELVTYALNIGEMRLFLDSVVKSIEEADKEENALNKHALLHAETARIKQKMNFENEIEQIYSQAEQVHSDFVSRLSLRFPEMTEHDKRLMVLLRIGFSSKEISTILNISPKSVEINRYRLRKKLKLNKDENLSQFINTI
jgi:inorganic phosphate transporter, PiT family